MRAPLLRCFLVLLVLDLSCALLAAPQGQSQDKKQDQKKADKDKDKDKDKSKKEDKQDDSVFAGTYDAKESKKKSDTATLGFNGVGPDGIVDEAKLKENPTGQDEMRAQQMSQVKATTTEVKSFTDDGKIKAR